MPGQVGLVAALRAAPRNAATATSPAAESAATRVLLQFRVIANAVRAHVPHDAERRPIGDRKLMALSAIVRAPGMGINAVAEELTAGEPRARRCGGGQGTTSLQIYCRSAPGGPTGGRQDPAHGCVERSSIFAPLAASPA